MSDKNSVAPNFPTEIPPSAAQTFIVLRVDGGPVVTITGTPELGCTLDNITEDLVIPALYGVGFKGVDAYFDCSPADPSDSDLSPADQPLSDQEPVKRDPLDPLDNPYAPW